MKVLHEQGDLVQGSVLDESPSPCHPQTTGPRVGGAEAQEEARDESLT